MQKTLFSLATTGLICLPIVAQADSPLFSLQDGDGFKRFSVSMGALHVMAQGKAQPIRVNTAVKDGEVADVGDISIDSVKSNLDPEMDANLSSTFVDFTRYVECRHVDCCIKWYCRNLWIGTMGQSKHWLRS